MGLLGDSWDDPQSLATLQLAGGLLSPGSLGQGMQRGLAGYQQSLAAAQDLAERKQAMQMQNAQMQMFQQKLALLNSVLGKTAAPASAGPTAGEQALAVNKAGGLPPGPLAQGAQPDQMPATSAPPGGGTPFPYSFNDVTALKLAGVADLLPEWKAAAEGIEQKPGSFYKDVNTGELRYNPDPTKFIDYDPRTRRVSPMAGSLETTAAQAGATAGAQEAAKARYQFVDVYDPISQATKKVRLDVAAGDAGPAPAAPMPAPAASASARISPQQQQAANQEQLRIMQAERANTPAGPDRDALDREIKRVSNAILTGQPFSASTAASARAPAGLATGPSAPQAAEQAALKEFGVQRLTKAHGANQTFVDNLDATVNNEAELQNRNAQLVPLLSQIKTGGFGVEGRIDIANKLQNSGMLPPDLRDRLSKWVADGDPTAGKVIENQLAAAGIKTMLDTLNKEGSPNRAIFQAVHDAQESVKSGNATLTKVFDLQKQLYDWHYQQQQAAHDMIASPDYNPLTFQKQFSAARNQTLQGTTAPAAPAATDMRALAAAELARRQKRGN